MDPVSFSASILTLLGAAGGSCKFIYDFIRDISDAPTDIRSQCVKLRCLQQTISNLIRVYSHADLPADLRMDPALSQHLAEFVREIAAIKAEIQRKACTLEKGRARHVWTRLSWLLSDRQIRRFYDTLDRWNTIFSQAVSATQLELSLRILTQTIPSQAPPQGCNQQALPVNGVLNYSLQYDKHTRFHVKAFDATLPKDIPIRLRRRLATISEPVSLKVLRSAEHWGSLFSAYIWLGPMITSAWSENCKEQYRTHSAKEGFCASISVQSKWLLQGRITVMIFAIYHSSRLNMQFDMRTSGYLAVNNAAYNSCVQGHWEQLRSLLAEGKVGLSDRTSCGETLLHLAIRCNHADIVSELLQAGADPNATNDLGQTPLHIAVYLNSAYTIAHNLVAHGADLSRQNLNGQSPLHTFFNTTSQSLIEHHYYNLDMMTLDYRGMSIMHYVSWSKSANTEDVLRCLAPSTSALDAKDKKGRTALHLALQRGNVELIQYFLNQLDESQSPSAFANLQPDQDGRTLLHYAVESRRLESVDLVLGKDLIDIRAVDSDRRTALHHAAAKGNLPGIKKLLAAGASADISALDKDFRTPLQVAMVCGQIDVVAHLQSLYGPQEVEVASDIELRGRPCQNMQTVFYSKLFKGSLVFLSVLLILLNWKRNIWTMIAQTNLFVEV